MITIVIFAIAVIATFAHLEAHARGHSAAVLTADLEMRRSRGDLS